MIGLYPDTVKERLGPICDVYDQTDFPVLPAVMARVNWHRELVFGAGRGSLRQISCIPDDENNRIVAFKNIGLISRPLQMAVVGNVYEGKIEMLIATAIPSVLS